MSFLYISLILSLAVNALYIFANVTGLFVPAELDIRASFQQRSLFTDTSQTTLAHWPTANRDVFSCTFENTTHGYYCGIDLRLADGLEQGEDLSNFTHIKFKLESRAEVARIVIYYRNAFIDTEKTSEGKQHETAQIITHGLNELFIPMNRFIVPTWWKDGHPQLLNADLQPQSNNVTHIGFYYGEPESIGTHEFKILELTAINDHQNIVNIVTYITFSGLLLTLLGVAVYRHQKATKPIDPKPKGDIRNELYLFQQEQGQVNELDMYDPTSGLMTRETTEKLLTRYAMAYSYAGMAIIECKLEEYEKIAEKYDAHIAAEYRSSTAYAIKTQVGKLGVACSWQMNKLIVFLPNVTAPKGKRIGKRIFRTCNKTRYSELNMTPRVTVKVHRLAIGESLYPTLESEALRSAPA